MSDLAKLIARIQRLDGTIAGVWVAEIVAALHRAVKGD